MATPRLIQCFCWCVLAIGTRMYITKLVECPVVDKVPWRKDVLYTGQEYTCAVPFVAPVYCSGTPSTRGTLTFSLGARWMKGISMKSTLEEKQSDVYSDGDENITNRISITHRLVHTLQCNILCCTVLYCTAQQCVSALLTLDWTQQ